MRDKNIQISHGAGGKLTHTLINEVFVKYFSNALLEVQGDSSIFPCPGTSLAMTTDSYVVSPIFFPGGDIGRLAVCGTVNDLAVSGANPLYLSTGFIIEEGFSLEELEKIVASMAATAKQAGVQIITGDTKVVHKGQCDKVFINTAGVGSVPEERKYLASGRDIKVGDKIIVTGNVAEHGMAILCARNELGISSPIQSDAAPLNGLIAQALAQVPAIKFMRDPTRGGLATTLVEIATLSKLGIDIEEKAVPVSEPVNGICELLGFDPLYIANEGKVIFVVAADKADDLIACLRSHEYGKAAAIVGTVTDEHCSQVVLKTIIGGKRVLDMLSGEQIPRIC